MSVKIDKVRYFVSGKEAPKKSTFSGKMNGEKLAGYYGYTSREEAKEEPKEIDKENKGYFNYTSSHHASYTRTSEGVLDSDEKIEDFQKLVAETFELEGSIAWENIISLSDFEEAEEHGLINVDDWQKCVEKALPKFYKHIGFDPENMLYWFDLHTNTEHPHIHLVFMEKVQTRKEGYLKPKELNTLKRLTTLELVARKRLNKKINLESSEVFKDKDVKFKKVIEAVDEFLTGDIEKDILKLYRILPKEGRLQYNSYNMKDYKPYIDKIIEEVILSDNVIKEQYDDWMKNIDLLNNNMNEIQNSKIATFKDAELHKLYTRIGNRILRNYHLYKNEQFDNNKDIKNSKYQKEYLQRERYSLKSRKKTIISKSMLGVYVGSVISRQQAEMDESLKEFLRLYDLQDLQM